MSRWSRRRFAARICQAVAALPAVSRLWPQAENPTAAASPQVRSFDLGLLYDWLTPTELFFIREHLPAPALSSSEWKLSVDGAVARPLEINYEELVAQSSLDLAVTLECAGNPAGGGLISNAQWAGMGLAALLAQAQPQAEARYVRLWGADRDPAQDAYYFRSIPLAKAMHPDTLLAHHMNGRPLPRHHGFPVRAIIPGWYGMDSVKWLRRVEVLTSEDTGWWMTKPYRREVGVSADGPRTSTPVTAMQVKAAFSRPLDGAVLVGRRFVVRGAAWAGEHRVRQVEVSTDGGTTWRGARLLLAQGGEPRPYAWVHWEYDWPISAPGQYELMARATDDAGRAQPPERSPERLDLHELNQYQRVRCMVL